ncbi:MAG: hypothetical protein DRJ52_09140 [Thermoprotei archaeon]|nr:MAG: hypothetical protein DRJ52_09140 [Thermoprotei archaeon]
MTQKGAAGEDTWAEVYNELGIPEIPRGSVEERNRSKNSKEKSKRVKSSFSAAWYNTKYGHKLKIQVGKNVLWLTEQEAKQLVFVILKELLK